MAAGGLALLTAAAAFAQPAQVAGKWSGQYTCSQGLTGMTVELRPLRGDEVDATIVFFAHPSNPAVESGCYSARGTFDRANGRLVLRPSHWIHRPSGGWRMTTLDGRIEPGRDAFDGRVVFAENPSACTSFALRRNARPFKVPPAQCTADAPMS